MKKRLLLIFALILAVAGVLLVAIVLYRTRIVFDVTRLSPTIVANVVKPESVEELQETIRSTDLPISFAGGRFSQGGQVAYPGGLVIDTTQLNKISAFDSEQKTISVQPGVRWRDIQQLIDPHDLSIKVMQSYNDFTVGGSLSVNVHGREPLGSLIKTVQAIKVMLPDGSIQTASREQNADLFYAALGGYGLLGPIVEATLQLTDNQKIERVIKILSIAEYPDYFFTEIKGNKRVVFHNANIYPNEFEQVLAITWYETDKPVTIIDRLQKKGLHVKEKLEEQLLKRFSPAKKLRQQIEPSRLKEQERAWRNYEMSYSVESLEPILRFPTTSILQEYFVPLQQLIPFVDKFRTIVRQYNVNVLNVSIRYVPADTESMLNYAPEDSFALVCYINVPRTISQKKERAWTQELIDAVLAVGGTFYLPYHLYATHAQFQKAYPRYKEFLGIKKKYDPQGRFVNSLYKAYMA